MTGAPPLSLPERFASARLDLRPPRLDDAPALFAAYAQDPLVTRYLVWRPHDSLDTTRAFLEHVLEQRAQGLDVPYVITRRGDDSAIGMLEVRLRGDTLGLGYVLARDHWGQGLMPEAVTAILDWAAGQPGCRRVEGLCDVDNLASARVLEKAGLRYETRLERHGLHPNISAEKRDISRYAWERAPA